MRQPKVIPIADGMPRDMRIIFGKPEDLSISQFSKVANVQDRQVDLLRLLQTLICHTYAFRLIFIWNFFSSCAHDALIF